MAIIQPTAHVFWNCGWERCWCCWPLWWTIPIRGHCSWMQFKKALGGCSKLTAPAILEDKESKKVVWSHMFLSCPPFPQRSPACQAHTLQPTRQALTQPKIWLSMGKKSNGFELSICWVKCPDQLQPCLLLVKQSVQKPWDSSWVQGNTVVQN